MAHRIPLITAALAIPLALAGQADAAQVAHKRVVSANPVNWTPHVLDGIVNAIAVVGEKVVVGGSFGSVQEAGGPKFERRNLFAYDMSSGKVDRGFMPEINGTVWALTPGARGSVYVGGAFTTVNRSQHQGLTRLYLKDGSRVGSFVKTQAGGVVYALARRGSRLYAGGDFSAVSGTSRTAIARLDHESGAVDPAFAVAPSGARGGVLKIYSLAATADRLIMDGSFTQVDGHARQQLAVIDTAASPARVADWQTDAYAPECAEVFPSYVRGLDVSPDGKYFVVVTTGGPKGAKSMCDTAARFETYARGSAIRTTWVNHTGGDSLYSVAVTGAAVYVGGHQRWLNNPEGSDSAGKGAVSRPGIGAIHPSTGKALSWNPTRERGIGVKTLVAHPKGLFVGSDTEELGREHHARLGMFPA